MAPAFSKLDVSKFTAAYSRNRPLIQRVFNIGFTLWIVGGTYRGLSAKKDPGRARPTRSRKNDDGSTKPPRVQVDAVFYQRLRAIMRIVIPGVRSKEAMLVLMHTSLLIFRTAISLYVANLDGKYVAITFTKEIG